MPDTMKPFKRAAGQDAPYYVKFMVKGVVHLWCTRTNDKELAKKRGKEYRDKIVTEQFHLVDLMKSRTTTAKFSALFKMYNELPLRAGTTMRNRAIGAMKIILKSIEADEDASLQVLNAKLAITYQQACIEAKENPVTINARLRFSRALFSKNAMVGYKAMGLAIKPEWVEDYCSVGAMQEPERMPEIPPTEMLRLAHEKLRPFPDVYRAFLLAAYAGLRSKEIAAARWDWIDGDILYVGGREFVAKSRKWRSIGLAPEVKKELELGEKAGDFIAGSSPGITVVRRLPGMLRDIGFASSTPVHSLRRLFGSNVAAVAGLWGAQNALGHANPQTTSKHYARQLNLAPAVGMVTAPSHSPAAG